MHTSLYTVDVKPYVSCHSCFNHIIYIFAFHTMFHLFWLCLLFWLSCYQHENNWETAVQSELAFRRYLNN